MISIENPTLRDIKPLLRQHCYSCHGALRQAGNLRLNTVANMIKGGESGPALQPGDIEHSEIWQRIKDTQEATRMPAEGRALNDGELSQIRD